MGEVEELALAIADEIDPCWPVPDDTDGEAPIHELRALAALFQVFREAHGDSEVPIAPLSLGSRDSAAQWGPLILYEEIGRGASSVVFRALDSRLGREVAAKMITGLEALPTSVASVSSQSVVEEGRLLARVRHPNVVTVFGADVWEGRVGIWMELIAGRTLEDLVQEQGQCSVVEAAAIGVSICGALSAIHREGLLHRDLKTQNVMRETGGRIVVMDLGAGGEVLERTQANRGSLAGTPLYMAPELFDGVPPSVQSDVYSLGVLLFRLVTATFPIRGATLAEVKSAHQSEQARLLADVRPGLPESFQRIVERALDVIPSRRFESVGGVHRDLAAFLQEYHKHAEPASHASVPTATRLRGTPARRWLQGALLITLGIIAGTVLTWMTIRTRDVATSSATKRQLIPQRTEQLNIAFAFEDLASSLGRRGDWLKAAAHFEQARQVYLSNVDEDAPLVALGHARVGWAQLKAGQLDDARYNLEVASYLFDQELGTKHPYGAVVMMALGATHQQRGDHAEAAADVSRALERRRAMLASLGMPVAHLALPLESTIGVATQRYSILEDADGDWISDVIEASFGLDPNSLDSDADGLPDGEELLGSPGIAAGTVLGLTSDPLKILAHYGSRDPQLLGFEQWRPFVGVATNAESWKVEVDVQSFYYVRLTEAQKELAAERGFRTTAMFKHHVGGGFINVDLGKSLRRWDIAVSGTLNDSVEIMANDSVAPALGRTFTYRSILSPVVQLIYDPLTSTAKLLANGRTQIDGYRGHMQFQEGHGFFFGAWNQIGIAPRGEIDYSLAMFEIR